MVSVVWVLRASCGLLRDGSPQFLVSWEGSCSLMVDPKRVSVIQCDVTESVILSDRYRGVTVRS